MADLHLRAVQWCAQHGHPVLSLRTADDRFFVVAIAAEDAGALAPTPEAVSAERSPRRQYGLIETLLATLGARLTEIRLQVGSDYLLRASLRLRGAQGEGELSLPASFADGIVPLTAANFPCAWPTRIWPGCRWRRSSRWLRTRRLPLHPRHFAR